MGLIAESGLTFPEVKLSYSAFLVNEYCIGPVVFRTTTLSKNLVPLDQFLITLF